MMKAWVGPAGLATGTGGEGDSAAAMSATDAPATMAAPPIQPRLVILISRPPLGCRIS